MYVGMTSVLMIIPTALAGLYYAIAKVTTMIIWIWLITMFLYISRFAWYNGKPDS